MVCTSLYANERSEGSELITEANLIFRDNNWKMKRAVGELSLRTKTPSDSRSLTLFPDVIIFSDEKRLSPVMGWELKMPDVPIDDKEFICNARDKANRLGTNVFVLWNFQFVSIYIRKYDGSWDNQPTQTFGKYRNELDSRSKVQSNSQIWKKQLYEVLSYLNQCLIDERFREASIEFNISNYIETITQRITPIIAEHLLNSGNQRLIKYIKYWVQTEKAELENIRGINTEEKFVESYSKYIIIRWINRFLFLHLLRSQNNDVNKLLVDFSENEDIENLKIELNRLILKTDFYTILHVEENETNLPNEVVSYLNEFNLYLANCDFSEVDGKFTSDILENIVDVSKRELMGLYTTSQGLARYLVAIVLEEIKGDFADLTVGSGMIAKVLAETVSKYKGINYAHEHIWLSDKYSYPLQIANLSVTSRESMHLKNIVFQNDVLNMNSGDRINIVNPSTGEKESLKLPKFNYIISNLPFISSNNRIECNTNFLRIIEQYDINLRSDLYQVILLKYKELLSENSNSKIGVITSNSWFKTQKDYTSFYKILSQCFNIESVIVSNVGKWFDNADIVTSIIVLRRKNENANPIVKFIGLNKNPSKCNDEEIDKLIQSSLFATTSSYCSVEQYKHSDILQYINLGMSLEGLFENVSWILPIKEKLIPLKKIFDGSRGVRTGADKIFITDSVVGDRDYNYPILKNLNNVDKYTIDTVKNYYLYIKHSEQEMIDLGHFKTLNYLKSVKKTQEAQNRISRLGEKWYKADQAPQYADFTTSINPSRRFFWSKFDFPTVVNQRVTAFRLKPSFKSEKTLIHALLNTVVSLFFLMSSGFGRGLGVTDLNKESIIQINFLNPDILSKDARDRILEAWKTVGCKEIQEIYQQLEDPDWIEFNKIVLREYNIPESVYELIKLSILGLLNRRLNVVHDNKK